MQKSVNCIRGAKTASFFVSLNKANKKDCLSRYIVFALSPVLKGIKPAELITLKASCSCLQTWQKHKGEIAKNIGLTFFELNTCETSVSVLWFAPLPFEKMLFGLKNSPLLQRENYPVKHSVKAVLKHLQSRFAGGEFPHEIGLFLGYPEEDVSSFITQCGQNYCICRYWKVYHNVAQANRIFKQIDSIRALAAALLAGDQPIQKTIRAIQAA